MATDQLEVTVSGARGAGAGKREKGAGPCLPPGALWGLSAVAPPPPEGFAICPLTLTQFLTLLSQAHRAPYLSFPVLLLEPQKPRSPGTQGWLPSCGPFLVFGPGPPLPQGSPCCQKTLAITRPSVSLLSRKAVGQLLLRLQDGFLG